MCNRLIFFFGGSELGVMGLPPTEPEAEGDRELQGEVMQHEGGGSTQTHG